MQIKTDNSVIQTVHQYLEKLINSIGLNNYAIDYIKLFSLLALLLIILWAAQVITRSLLTRFLRKFASRTSTLFDDFLLANNLPVYIARWVPLTIASKSIPLVFNDFKELIPSVNLVLDVYGILIGVAIFRTIFRTLKDYLKTKESFKDKPIDSYMQVMVIILYFIAGVLIFTTITGKSVVTFFTTLGAASAVLLLIFKDTILGFVASIQVTVNDMVRIGDWITMEKYGADGDVTEITLTTVKVQNFDKTITTIPTYNLISDSFKNWRGMRNAGGRRIKRPIRIKIASIKFLSEEDIIKLKKIHLIESYLEKRHSEITAMNIQNNVNRSLLINGKSLTNIGVFRVYIDEYLKHNPYLHKDMIMMVRQLEPQNDGIPLELYTFTSDTLWKNYERIMADIFDHLLAAVEYFDLEIFEAPSSGDFKSFLKAATLAKVQ